MTFNEDTSFIEYNVEQPTQDFVTNFSTIGGTTDVVLVTVDGVLTDTPESSYTVQQINHTTWRVTPEVPAGSVVRLYRVTNIDEMMHVFTAGAKFIARNMDNNFKQIRHAQQEVRDAFEFLESNTLGVVEAAREATERANEAADEVEGLLDKKLTHNDLKGRDADDAHPDSAIKTWSGRTQEQKNKDSVHVLDFKQGKTDQEAIQDAVNYCLANNRTLDWDGAHLTSTSNVLNMWDVTHIGNGSITRNGNVFYFNNIGKESTIHVTKYVAGMLPVNDGLSPDFPIYPGMINRFFDNFNVLHGNYVFQFKAAVYANSSLNRVYIGGLDKTECNINQLSGAIIFRGADVGFNFDSLANATAVPTTVFGSESTSTNSILFNLRNASYRFESIKGINQNGLVSITNGTLVVRNAHGLGNARDIISAESFLDVTGGILDGGVDRIGTAINSFFLTKHNIGSQANTAQQTPIIRRKSTGFLVQEGSTGHSDFVTYEDCGIGSLANVNARINTNGSTYTNCAVGVRASNGGNVYVPDNVVFNNCTENVRIQNSEIVSNVGTSHFSYADKEVRIFTSVTPFVTGTNTRELVSRIEMPPFVLKSGSISSIWQGKKIKIVCRGVITGVSGTKRFDIYATSDSTVITGSYITNATTLADSNGAFEFVADLIISSNVVCASKLTTSYGARQVVLNNNIVDSNLFATRPFILLTCLCESASDTVQVNSVECYMSS